ncbi:hypothetical protein BaRGS_00001322 [Batillaria attramentaria]|uniref:Uncharacterized protein n=1 Tax=Batillaria attramentaria TaxID=370345 RepID=A0ABD0M7T2_9CAEN
MLRISSVSTFDFKLRPFHFHCAFRLFAILSTSADNKIQASLSIFGSIPIAMSPNFRCKIEASVVRVTDHVRARETSVPVSPSGPNDDVTFSVLTSVPVQLSPPKRHCRV